MGTNEWIVVTEGQERQGYRFRHHGDPFLNWLVLYGPQALLEERENADHRGEPESAFTILALDPAKRHADLDEAPVDEVEHEELARCWEAVVIGVFAAMGWTASFSGWPMTRPLTARQAAQVWALVARSPLQRSAIHPDALDPLYARAVEAGWTVRRHEGMPVLVEGRGGQVSLTEAAFAFGVAHAAGLLGETLGDVSAWLQPPTPAAIDWTRLFEDRAGLASDLAARHGGTVEEMEENLRESLAWEQRRTPAASMDALAEAVQQAMIDAGLVGAPE